MWLGLNSRAGLVWGPDSQAGCPSLRSVSILYSLWFSLAETRIPSATHWWWPDPLGLRARVKSPSIQALVLGPQLKPPSWECSLLGTSAVSGAPGRHEPGREGRSFRGEKQWDPRPWGFAQSHSTQIYGPGSWPSLRLWLQAEPELGMTKCCHHLDISCNYNLPTGVYWHLCGY